MANDTLAGIHDTLVAMLSLFFGTVHFSQERWGWWDLRVGGGSMRKEKWLSRGGGGGPKKIKGKAGKGHVKYLSNTLKRHNVLLLKELLWNRRSRKYTNLLHASLPL